MSNKSFFSSHKARRPSRYSGVAGVIPPSPCTPSIMIEGVQGEGGITPATPEYLLGLRALCDEKKLLLLMDGVQCGHYRTGRFQSFQRILEGVAGKASENFFPRGFFERQVARRRFSHRRVLGPRTV